MNSRTVEWTPAPTEGLRERKKRLLRQQLSDTATEMFMARGFDAVRVIEVAQACGVSEKTVYNYFPTKESLVLDRGDATLTSLRVGLAQAGASPVEAALAVLDGELRAMTSWLATQPNPIQASSTMLRFGQLIRATPALRAHQREMADRLITAAAEILAERTGMDPEAPEPQIAATALLGLWEIQYRSLRRHLAETRTPAEIVRAVTADVQRAARLLSTGLSGFADTLNEP